MRPFAFAIVIAASIPSAALAQNSGQFQGQGLTPIGGSLQSGGLTSPPPLSPSEDGVDPTSYDSSLEESRRNDSRRPLSWFWLDGAGGFETVGLHTFNTANTSLGGTFVKNSASGGVVSAGLGARALLFTLGARARLGFFQPWQLSQIGGELGVHIPLGIFEPHVDLGGGYAALGHFDHATVPTQIEIHGAYARAQAGLDIYPVRYLSLGLAASFDFLALTRPALTETELGVVFPTLPPLTAAQQAQEKVMALDGHGDGASFALLAMVGLHL